MSQSQGLGSMYGTHIYDKKTTIHVAKYTIRIPWILLLMVVQMAWFKCHGGQAKPAVMGKVGTDNGILA